ncbi:MAG: carboxypeptidase regulatory-like domain-containing protein [Gemmatimonadaceae bacterium]|nr:carboxypeptidase regulatory-like domain-containing protein [Gemmatimonadaceae bacterium]
MTPRTNFLVAVMAACVSTLGAAPVHAQEQEQEQASPSPGRLGRVDITSVDSITRLPLAGASVRLVSVLDTTRVHDATLDERGRARVDNLPAGPWVLTARHARLDTLGVGSVAVPFTVRAGRGVTVRATVPSVGTLVARVCGSAAIPGTGYLFGTVRRAVPSSELPPSAGQVTAQWLDLRIEEGRVERTIVTTEVPVGDNGRYVVCGVPTETTVRLRALGADAASGVATFTSSASAIAPRDLLLGRADAVAAAPSGQPAPEDSSLVDVVLRGEGGVRGTVQTDDGRPLANAVVMLTAAGLDTRTDSAGRFVLAATPTGTWTLDVRALGYAPWQQPVDLVPGDTVAQVVAMARAEVMDTVRVRANAILRTALGRNLAAFEERQRMGIGRFVGPADLEEMVLFRFTDALREMPGIRLAMRGNGTDRVILMRGTRGGCVPTVFVDRMRMPGTDALDSFIPPDNVAAVEVYQAGYVPAEFQDIFSGCGSIVVWTGPRR